MMVRPPLNVSPPAMIVSASRVVALGRVLIGTLNARRLVVAVGRLLRHLCRVRQERYTATTRIQSIVKR